MTRLLPVLLSIILLSCSSVKVTKYTHSTQTIVKGKRITVTGVARNAKAGAVVVIEDGSSFYIDGMEIWKSSDYNKTVVASGRLVTIYTEPDSGVVMAYIRIQPILKRPRYKIIDAEK